MQYLYSARFTDGTRFHQPLDDSSVLRPGEKSATYDLLEHMKSKQLAALTLWGTHVLAVRTDGSFTVNGSPAKPGCPLPAGVEWVEGDPAQGPYFRRVTLVRDGTSIHRHVQFCIGQGASPGVRNFLGASDQ